MIVQRHRHFSTDKRNGPQGYFLLKDIRKTESLIAENRKLCALDYIFSTFLCNRNGIHAILNSLSSPSVEVYSSYSKKCQSKLWT